MNSSSSRSPKKFKSEVSSLELCLPAIADISNDADDVTIARAIKKRRRTQHDEDSERAKSRVEANRTRANLRDQWANISKYQPDEFREKFRMRKRTVVLLEELLARPFGKILKNQRTGRGNISLRERLLLTLFTLSSQESFRKVSARFNVAEGTSHNIFIDTCNLIKELTRNYISLPDDFQNTAKEFKEVDNCFPGVIGIVNCLDIPILTPIEDKASYYSPSAGTYCLKMQTLCDSSGRFLNVFIGYPGAYYNAEMWGASRLYKMLCDKKISLPKNQHFIADSTYPLDTFLMTPYKADEANDVRENNFNDVLMATQSISQNAFKQLRGRFGRLRYMHMNKISDMKVVALAACILHNFVLLHEKEAAYEDFGEIECVTRRSIEGDFSFEFGEEICSGGNSVQANVKRHTISEELLRKIQINLQ